MKRRGFLPKTFIGTGVIVPIISLIIMSKDSEAFGIPLSYCIEEINGVCLNKVTFFDSLTFSIVMIAVGLWLSFSAKQIIKKD